MSNIFINTKNRSNSRNYLFLIACYEFLKSCIFDTTPTEDGSASIPISTDDNITMKNQKDEIELARKLELVAAKEKVVDFFKLQKDRSLQIFSNKLSHNINTNKDLAKLFTTNPIMHKIIESGLFKTEKAAKDLFTNIKILTKDKFIDLMHEQDYNENIPLYKAMGNNPKLFIVNIISETTPEFVFETPFIHVNNKGETFLHLSIKLGSNYVEKCLNSSIMNFKVLDKDISYKEYYINKKTKEGKSALNICLDLMKSNFNDIDPKIKYLHQNNKVVFLKDLYKTLSLLISCGARYNKNEIIKSLTHNLNTEANSIKKLLDVAQKQYKLTNPNILSSEPGADEEWDALDDLPSTTILGFNSY